MSSSSSLRRSRRTGAAAGWYIANARASRAPVAGSAGREVPWTCPIRSPGMNVPERVRPSVTTTAGSSTSSWRRRYGAQAAISSGCGSRLPGGRHFTTLVMKTSSRRQPTDSMQLDQQTGPSAPTNGRPGLVLVAPGSLADEHDLRVGAALPRHGPGSRLRRSAAAGAARGPPPRSPRARPAPSVVRHVGRRRTRRRRARAAARAGRDPAPLARASRRSRPRWSRRPCAGCRETTQKASPRPSGDRRVAGGPGRRRSRRVPAASIASGYSWPRGRPGRRPPGPRANSSRARSGVIGSRVSTWTASEWLVTNTGIRTAVHEIRRSGRWRILRLSVTTFHSSFV